MTCREERGGRREEGGKRRGVTHTHHVDRGRLKEGKGVKGQMYTSCYVMRRWTERDKLEPHKYVGGGNAFTLCYHD